MLAPSYWEKPISVNGLTFVMKDPAADGAAVVARLKTLTCWIETLVVPVQAQGPLSRRTYVRPLSAPKPTDRLRAHRPLMALLASSQRSGYSPGAELSPYRTRRTRP